jgi:hypothetical protein
MIREVMARLAISHPEAKVNDSLGGHSWKRGPYEARVTIAPPPYDVQVTLKEYGKKDRPMSCSFTDHDLVGAICRHISSHLRGRR